MQTDYEAIGRQYQAAKLQPWRWHVEAFSLMSLVGDPAGKTVLDLACGGGFYTRLLRAAGATKVTGVDLSPTMIDIAREHEVAAPLGIHYVTGDGRHLDLGETYDLVVAAYLLNYAHTAGELREMMNSVARCLKPGGRFVTVNSNPFFDPTNAPSFHKYGFTTKAADNWREEAILHWKLLLDDSSIEIENYHLSANTHEDAFRAAGFRSWTWHKPSLEPRAATAFGIGYWSDLLQASPMICLECVK
jgi:ubiquinone/menaquinone biosynthesis C-methylase UbiE